MRKLVTVALLVVISATVWWLTSAESDARPIAEPAEISEPAPDRERVDRRTRRSTPPDDSPKPAPEFDEVPGAPTPSADSVAPADTGRTLRVVSIDGEPIAGARIAFLEFDRTKLAEVADAPISDDGPFAWVAERGQLLRSDAAGNVPVPRFPIMAFAIGRLGELRGRVTLSAEDSGAWILRLETPVRLRVDVVTDTGAPVADIQVHVMGVTDAAGTYVQSTAQTQADGRATFTLLSDDRAEEGESTHHVTLGVPLATAPTVDVDLRALPDEPLRLVLPPTGSVTCRVEGDVGGSRHAVLLGSVAANLNDDAELEAGVTLELVAARAARFAHVGTGMQLKAVLVNLADQSASVQETFAGPVAAGDDVTVVLRVGAPRPAFVGRIVTPDGTPVADLSITADLIETGAVSGGTRNVRACTTGADGGFRFEFDREPGNAPGAQLRIGRVVWRGRVGSLESVASIDVPDEIVSGEFDVGDVPFAGNELLLAGTVQDEQGRPLANATVGLMEHTYSMRSSADGVSVARTDASGRFELRGAVEGRPVEVGVGLDGYILDDDSVLRLGATDMILVLRPAGGIAGSVQVPDGVDPSDIRVGVTGDPQRNNDTDSRFGDSGLLASLVDGEFQFTTLRPGTATVRIAIGYFGEETLLSIDDIDVVAGTISRDARLQNIDLSRHLGGFTIRARAPKGEPVLDAVVHYRDQIAGRGRGADTYWNGARAYGAESIRVLSASKELDVMVTAPGRRTVSLRDVSDDRTVVLEPVPLSDVIVTLAPGAKLPPAPYELSAQLKWRAPVDGPLPESAGWGDDPRSPDQAADTVLARKPVTLRAWEPGRYTVELTLAKMDTSGGSGRSIATVPAQPIVTITGDGATHRVEIAMDWSEFELRRHNER